MRPTTRPDAAGDFLLPVVGLILGSPPQGWQASLQSGFRQWGWPAFQKVLWENRLTLRGAYALRRERAAGRLPDLDFPDAKLEELIATDEARQRQNLEYLQLLSDRVELDFIFIKTVDNFPDFGHDVDLLTREPGDRVKDAFRRAGFAYANQKLAERIADKMSFTLGTYLPAEAHCARIGEFGEHRELTTHMLDHREIVELGGVRVWGPDRISRIFLIVLQRLYRHFNVRGCDAVNVIEWIRQGKVDLDELYIRAARFGILPGVRWLLRFANEVCAALAIPRVAPGEPPSDELTSERWLFRFNRVRFIPAMYGRKLAWSLGRMQWEAAGREILVVPVALLALISHKVLKKDAIW